MNLQQLRAFVLAVDLQKLYLVAGRLGVTQPTVTFHLNKLQEELGIALFHTKSYHVIKLTEAGQAFYHYASQINALASEAEALIDTYKGTEAGKLSIGSTHMPAAYLLPPVLNRLNRDNPGLSVMLDVRPAPYIMDKIKRYELDAGIVSQTSFNDPDLIAWPLVRDDLVFIAAPDHPLAGVDGLTPGDLSRYPFISHEEGSISRQLIDDWAARCGIKLTTVLEVSGSEALKAAVRQGMGFGMLSETSARKEEEEGKLCVKPLPGWNAERHIYAVRHRNKLVSPALRSFWELIEKTFGR